LLRARRDRIDGGPMTNRVGRQVERSASPGEDDAVPAGGTRANA
jgi:hypothetical protein